LSTRAISSCAAFALAVLFVACGTPAAAPVSASTAPSAASSARAPDAPQLTIEEGLVDVGGVQLFVRSVGGKNGGPGVILVHGGPGLSHEYMKPLEVLATPDYRVVSYDQRGVGRSPAVGDDALGTHAADLDAVRAHFGMETVDVIAHSWGGLVAIVHASHFPARLRSLALVDSLPPTEADFAGALFAFSKKERKLQNKGLVPQKLPEPENGDCTKYLTADLPVYYFNPRHPTTKDLAGSRCSDEAFKKAWADNAGYDLTADLARIAAPVVVFRGDSDPFNGNLTDPIVARLPGKPHGIILPACGHLPFEECPEALLPALNAFLSLVHDHDPTAEEERACDQGNGRVCKEIGDHFSGPKGKDRDKARSRYVQGCDAGFGEACAGAGRMAFKDAPDDPTVWMGFATKGCDLGVGAMCAAIGISLVKTDAEKGWASLERACDLGDGEACYTVGEACDEADGRPADPKKAFVSYTRACEARVAGACTNLATFYYGDAPKLEGVARDVEQTVLLLDKACRLGSKTGCDNLDIVRVREGRVDELTEGFE
jgi:pimeloyl-ACP methyl ester carboxylesterase